MTIEYTRRQTISAVEMGWSGISMSDLIIGTPGSSEVNEHYIESLELKLGTRKGEYSRRLRNEVPHDIGNQTQALTNMCFRDALHVLEQKLHEALDLRYKYAIRGGVPGEAVYRDPKTKELVKVSGNIYSKHRYGLDKTEINVWSTKPETAKRLLIGSIKERPDELSLKTEDIVSGLEDLTSEAQPHGIIFWDEASKGLIKISPGYNFQIPEYSVETTSELDIQLVADYLRDYLRENRIPS